jgi:HEAT repeat protein
MKIKYIAALIVLCVVVAVVVYSQRNAPNGKPPAESKSESAPVKTEDAPSQPQTAARSSGVTVEELEERRVEARLEAIEAMEKLNDAKTVTALGNALADPNQEVKDAALQALSERKGANVTEMIRRGLSDADPDFRIEVLEALAERGDLDSLRKAKSDPNEEVRERATDLLESAGN